MAPHEVPPEEIAELFSFYDSDGNGVLDMEEMCAMLTLMHRDNLGDDQFTIRHLAKLWDRDGDGAVTATEMGALPKKLSSGDLGGVWVQNQ